MVQAEGRAASGQHRQPPSQQREAEAARAVWVFSKGHSAAVRTKLACSQLARLSTAA